VANSTRKHFIFVAPDDLAAACVREGVARLPEDQALPRLTEGDGVVVYAPRTAARNGDRIEMFVAIGQVADAAMDFPRVNWSASATPAAIHPLLPRLDLTRLLGAQWEQALAKGRIAVSAADFAAIAEAMGYAEKQ
jgi:hypothetical protein